MFKEVAVIENGGLCVRKIQNHSEVIDGGVRREVVESSSASSRDDMPSKVEGDPVVEKPRDNMNGVPELWEVIDRV